MRAARILVWAGGASLCLTLLVGAIRGPWPPADKAAVTYGAALVALTIGIAVWELRPESRTGPLLTAWPIASVLADLYVVFSGSAFAVTVGLACSYLYAPVFAHLVLAYPSGRLQRRLDRVVVAIGYAYAVAYGFVLILLYDPRPQYENTILELDHHAVPLTHVGWFAMRSRARSATPRSSLRSGCPSGARSSTRRGGPWRCRRREPTAPSPCSGRPRRPSERSCTIRHCSSAGRCSRPPGRRRGSRSRTSGSRRRFARSSPSSAPREPAS